MTTRPTLGSVSADVMRRARKLKAAGNAASVALWLASAAAAALGLFLLDNFLALPAAARIVLVSGTAAALLLPILRGGVCFLRRRGGTERAARLLERRFGVQDNRIVNACQLEGASVSGLAKDIADSVVAESRRELAASRPVDTAMMRRLARVAVGLALAAIAWAVYTNAAPERVRNAFQRFATVSDDLPPYSDASVSATPSSDVWILKGDDVVVASHTEHATSNGRKVDVSPPVVAWREGDRVEAPLRPTLALSEDMTPDTPAFEGTARRHVRIFKSCAESFAFRVFACGTYTKSTVVRVGRPPSLISAVYVMTPPAYTGAASASFPGPPASLDCLQGSKISLTFRVDVADAQPRLFLDGKPLVCQKLPEGGWRAEFLAETRRVASIHATALNVGRDIELASSTVEIRKDAPPTVDFATSDRNRLLQPGARLELPIEATDDHGIRGIRVVARAEGGVDPAALREWTFNGPPGPPSVKNELFIKILDPSEFKPGIAYTFSAECWDFSPSASVSASRPVVVRIKNLAELAADAQAVGAEAFSALRDAYEEQRKAHAATANILENKELLSNLKSLARHCEEGRKRQETAKVHGVRALAILKKGGAAGGVAAAVETLAEREMPLALAETAELSKKGGETLALRLEERQRHIRDELLRILGETSAVKGKDPMATPPGKAKDDDPSMDSEILVEEIKDEMKDYVKSEKRILELTKELLQKGPGDLTDADQAILGQLAREQAEWSKIFQEKLTDLSKLPAQDFSDASISKELNEVFQEVKLAEKSLYEKKFELAIPHEQSGIENAEELIQNLEKWLPDTPDHIKWTMEDPLQQADVAIPELPAELEDIIGELIDSEESLTDEAEDASSSWMDSLDKGAGWGASDGPISNMSAKGVTGNTLPNNNEVGGRSGEGRTGRSHGQIVEATASGKGGRPTPSRLTPEPFERGSVDDSSKDPGGATGGGKLSGFSEQGLIGPTPDQKPSGGPRLQGRQTALRQKAEAVAAKVMASGMPSGEIESSIQSMRGAEDALRSGAKEEIRRSMSAAVDRLRAAKSQIAASSRDFKEKNRMTKSIRDELSKSATDPIPKGYEKMVGEYYKSLAE